MSVRDTLIAVARAWAERHDDVAPEFPEQLWDAARAEIRAEVLREAAAELEDMLSEYESSDRISAHDFGRRIAALYGRWRTEEGEKATATIAATATPQPEPEFFVVGRTYGTGQDGYTAPELTALFRVEHITRHPEHGHLRAIGWARTGEPDSRWHGHFVDEDEFSQWRTEVTDPAPESESTASSPELTARQRRLLDAIRTAGPRQQWSTTPVEQLYRAWHIHTPRHEAQRDLARLAGLGHLVVVPGTENGRRYRLNIHQAAAHHNSRKDHGR